MTKPRFLVRLVSVYAVIAVATWLIVLFGSDLLSPGHQEIAKGVSMVWQIFLAVLAFFIYPALTFAVNRDIHLRWIREFWQPHLNWLWVLVALTLLSSGVALAFPLLYKYVIDIIVAAVASDDQSVAEDLKWKAIWLFVILGVGRSLTHLYPGFRAMINLKIGMDVREHYFSIILEKGHRFFNKFRTGDLVTRLTDDVEAFPKIAWFACSGYFRALESASKFLFCIGFMLYLNWKITLLSMIPVPIMLTVFYFVRMALTKASFEVQESISSTNERLEAAFSGVRIIKAFRAESNLAQSFKNILDDRIIKELRLMKLRFGLHQLYQWAQFMGQVIVMIAGGKMVIAGTMSIGTLYAFYVYLDQLMAPLMDIPHLFVSSRTAFACIDREIEMENTPGGTEGYYTGTNKFHGIDSIELRNTDFTFDGATAPALKNINLSLKRGEKAAVVGSVGSGKSTLIKVVAGLIPPSGGEVLINGKPVNYYDIRQVRSRFGYIPQESTLFSESVADNVKFGRDISDDKVRDSLDMAQVLDEMEALENGLDEVLGQKGLTVSGGQKQRLAIARALAGKPDLLLMDDCTSALDAENERRFWNMFAEKSPDAACLIVTHRLATARQADVIYVIHEGKIVGKGTHEELLRDCEDYRNFLTREELQAALAG
jgi:ATP-binding cassette subfamily B protein